MTFRKSVLAAAAVVAVIIATGCSSSSKSTGTSGTTASGGGSGGKTLTIGILTDVTGLGASGNKTTVEGVEAGMARAATQGYHFKYVVGDTQTSPSGALSAAHLLVQQDHVTAVIANGAVTFAAAPYLTSHGIPVVGADEDGTEWITSKNMFSVYGYLDETKVYTNTGQLFKMLGATVIGTVGYGISPSSSASAENYAVSSQIAGLKVGYVNSKFPFGSTNVEPVALAMKDAGVNGFYSATDPNTGFALYTALKQLGVNVKVAYFPTGYGGDLVQAGPGALRSAQNAIFATIAFQPVEAHTAATQQFVSDLKSVGVTSLPTEAEYIGYASVAALVEALKVTGPNPSGAALISALAGVKNFNAWGLMGRLSMDLNDRTGTASGPDGCGYYSRLSGSSFEQVPGASPLCGTNTGKTVSAG